MSDRSKPDRITLGRRGLMRRVALLGLGAAAIGGGMVLDGSQPAEAQGYPYPPVPPPRYQPVPPPPGARFIWQPGHWQWNGRRYAWFPGRYIPRGPRYGRFIPGHWARRYGRWVWIPQHWR